MFCTFCLAIIFVFLSGSAQNVSTKHEKSLKLESVARDDFM